MVYEIGQHSIGRRVYDSDVLHQLIVIQFAKDISNAGRETSIVRSLLPR
jgi:hypothetical protein